MAEQQTIVVQIDEVDLANRTVHVKDKTGGKLKVAFRAQGAAVRIPTGGEKWTAVRQGYEWHLERRLDEDADHLALADLLPGDTRVSAAGLLRLVGEDIIINGTSFADLLEQIAALAPMVEEEDMPVLTIIDVQEFSVAGAATWIRPEGAGVVVANVISGSPGAGSGTCGAAGGIRTGGAGGPSAQSMVAAFFASDLGGTVPVVVGAAGVGGASVGPGVSNGNPGTVGGESSFGSVIAKQSGFGSGGTTSTVSGSSSGATDTSGSKAIDIRASHFGVVPATVVPPVVPGMVTGGGSASSSGLGSAGGSGDGTPWGNGGGGGGGSLTAANAEFAGGAGGFIGRSGTSSEIAGGAGGAARTNGTPGTAFARGNGTGSGGGGSSNDNAVNAGNGANATGHGGAGGGGAATSGGTAVSGKGGDGLPGRVVVYTFGEVVV